MNNNFEFKRGDSVLHNLIKDGKLLIRTALVLSVDKDKIEVRVDEDSSLWSTDLEGNAYNFEGTQFLKIQKVFDKVELKRGALVTGIAFNIEYIEECNLVKATVFYENDEKSEIDINILENNYIDFHDKYKYVKELRK